MSFNLTELEKDSLSFDQVKASLFKGLPPAMESIYKHQRYFIHESRAAAPGTVTRWVAVWATSGVTPHPLQSVYLPPGCIVTGGGARDNWTGQGNLLTGSYPLFGSIHGWEAEGKDHEVSDPASITVWAIGLEIEGISPV